MSATATLASLCAARGAVLIYISTDYVFPGRPGEAPYAADAEPAPANTYGRTKLEGERAALAAFQEQEKEGGGAAVVLRVPVLYGDAEVPAESAVNILMDALWKSQDRVAEGAEKIKMDHWARRYPTNTEDVGRVCHGMPPPLPPFLLSKGCLKMFDYPGRVVVHSSPPPVFLPTIDITSS